MVIIYVLMIVRSNFFSLFFFLFSMVTLQSLFSKCFLRMCVHAQSSLILCNSIDCSPPTFSIPGIFQSRKLGRIAISFSRESSWSRAQTCLLFSRQILNHWATWEVQALLAEGNRRVIEEITLGFSPQLLVCFSGLIPVMYSKWLYLGTPVMFSLQLAD